MNASTAVELLQLVEARHGHFCLESGHHSALWLDLDALFAEPRRIAPFVSTLADALRPHNVTAVCGPLLGGAFLAQLVAHALDVDFSFTERTLSPERTGLYPVRYRLPPALRTRVGGARIALVDDAMSAGSALLATYAELQSHGGVPVVAGALLLLGSSGAAQFAQCGMPVEAVVRQAYELWTPAECPLCASGVPCEEIS